MGKANVRRIRHREPDDGAGEHSWPATSQQKRYAENRNFGWAKSRESA
jgi:hypothetical protein